MNRLPLSAFHGAVINVLGQDQGQSFANVTAGENPHRAPSWPEVAALAAWVATGVQSASDLPLEAIEVATPSGKPTVYRGDDLAAMAGLFGSKFGDYVWRALQVGAGELVDTAGRVENVAVGVNANGLAVSVVVSAAGQTVAAHYGRMIGQAERFGHLPANAFRLIAATAPSCVPAADLPYLAAFACEPEDATPERLQ